MQASTSHTSHTSDLVDLDYLQRHAGTDGNINLFRDDEKKQNRLAIVIVWIPFGILSDQA